MVQLASQSTFFSSSASMRRSSGATRSILASFVYVIILPSGAPPRGFTGRRHHIEVCLRWGPVILRGIGAMRRTVAMRYVAAILLGSALAQPALAAPCRNNLSFERWLE